MAKGPSIIDVITVGPGTEPTFPTNDEMMIEMRASVAAMVRQMEAMQKEVAGIREVAADSQARIKRLGEFTARGASGRSLSNMVESIFNKLGCQ